MDATSILTLYLIFFFLELGFELFLNVINANHVKKNRSDVPEAFRNVVSPEDHLRHTDYTLTNLRFALVSSLVSAAVLLAAVLSGIFGHADRWLLGFGLPPYIHGIVFVFLISLGFRLAAVPFGLYRQFVIEERFGFNTMTGRLYLLDFIKGLLLSAVIGFIILFGLFWFVDTMGDVWWLYGFLFFTAFQLIVSILYPLIIAPLFNKFTPLEDGTLKDKLLSLAARLKFRTKGLFVMDGSRRSKHANAYFTGLGKVKRIVLFDTLLSTLSEDQITAVLAHEIGHEKMRHIVKRLVIVLPVTLAALYIVHLLMNYQPLFTTFGFDETSTYGIVIILSICASPFTFMLTPLMTMWSRRHEYQADRFAVQAMGRAEHLKQALLILGKENLTNLTPHPLYSFYHYSHPGIGERIRAMDEDEDEASGAD